MGFCYGDDHDSRLREEESMLVNFIRSKAHLVHPNVMKLVQKQDIEGIRMALNHIHYGSIKEARDRNNLLLLRNEMDKCKSERHQQMLVNNKQLRNTSYKSSSVHHSAPPPVSNRQAHLSTLGS